MTNIEEVFDYLTSKGQYPRVYSDTYILLELMGHRLDREVERCYQEGLALGLDDRKVTEHIDNRISTAVM